MDCMLLCATGVAGTLGLSIGTYPVLPAGMLGVY